MHEKKQAEKIMKNLDREEQTLSDLASLLYEMHDYQEAIARTTMDREPRLGSLAEMRGLNQYALGYIKQAKKSY